MRFAAFFAICGILSTPVLAATPATTSPTPANATAKASNATSNTTAILQPDTELNEFKNQSVAADAVDPGDLPVVCPLTSKNISDADMASVKSTCDTSSLNAKNSAGSNYCLNCGCALDVMAYKTMQSSSLLNKTTDDDLLDACAQWSFEEAVSSGALDANAVAALKVCAPIDFVCKSYSKHLNASYITSATEDQLSVLGSGVQDAVQSAAGNASAAAAAAAHAARSSGAAAAAVATKGSVLLLALSALLVAAML